MASILLLVEAALQPEDNVVAASRVNHRHVIRLSHGFLDVHLRGAPRALLQIHHVEVIVKLAVEPSEHHKAVADKNAGVASPRLGSRMADI